MRGRRRAPRPPAATAAPCAPPRGDGSPDGRAHRAPTAAAAPVEIEWFIGLGTGQNEEQVAAENKVVEEFNATPPQHQAQADDRRQHRGRRHARDADRAGDAPDIIGPVGIRGLQQFGDQLLDLTPYLAGADLSEIEPALISAFNVNGKQIGLPTGVYSSFIYYNKDLFKEAGLAEPPHEVGAQYEGKAVDLGHARGAGREAHRRRERQRRNELRLRCRARPCSSASTPT